MTRIFHFHKRGNQTIHRIPGVTPPPAQIRIWRGDGTSCFCWMSCSREATSIVPAISWSRTPVSPENPGSSFISVILWMDRILHYLESMRNHCLLAFTGESSFAGILIRWCKISRTHSINQHSLYGGYNASWRIVSLLDRSRSQTVSHLSSCGRAACSYFSSSGQAQIVREECQTHLQRRT